MSVNSPNPARRFRPLVRVLLCAAGLALFVSVVRADPVYYVADGQIHVFDGKKDEVCPVHAYKGDVDPASPAVEDAAALQNFRENALDVVGSHIETTSTLKRPRLLILGKRHLGPPDESIHDTPPFPGSDLWYVCSSGVLLRIAIHAYDAALSPDGRMIAYSTNANLAPDGSLLAYDSPNDSVIVTSTDGTIVRRIENADSPAWFPDGSAVVFAGIRRSCCNTSISATQIDAGARPVVMLVYSGCDPSFHPSGRWILFNPYVSNDDPIDLDFDPKLGRSSKGGDRIVKFPFPLRRYSFAHHRDLPITRAEIPGKPLKPFWPGYPIHWSADGLRFVYASSRSRIASDRPFKESGDPMNEGINTVVYWGILEDGGTIRGPVERDGRFLGWLGPGYTMAVLDDDHHPHAVDDLEPALLSLYGGEKP